MKFYNEKARAQTVLFIANCFFTTFSQQLVRATVEEVINVDVQGETGIISTRPVQ